MIRHDGLALHVGRHLSPADGSCLMELVSACAGEAWSDRPSCTHPLLAHVARRVNDAMSDGRRPSLAPFISPLVGATSPDAHAYARIALTCTDLALSHHPSLLLSLLNGAAVRRSTARPSLRGHRLYNRGTAFRSVDLAVFAVVGLPEDRADDALRVMLACSLDALKPDAHEAVTHRLLSRQHSTLRQLEPIESVESIESIESTES